MDIIKMKYLIDRLTGESTVIKDYEGQWAATLEDAMMAVAWTLAGYRSAKEGREIRKEELFYQVEKPL